MAYSKTTWQNNVTDIDENNLNKIEQGIYDNSLVVDAVTNTLNPTDTETYKTAELTEGQITDVIGVSDIVIKGQTLQDGTPTPSAPVDVNVVKGSNAISICNKNLFNNIATSQTKHGIVFTINADKSIYANGTATSTNALALNQVYLEKEKTYFLSGCPSGGGSGKYTLSINTTGTTTRLATDAGSGVSYTPTESGTYDISIGYWYGFNLNNLLFKPQIEVGSTATTYEEHQEKSYTINLGTLELCKIENYQDYFYKSGSKWYLHKEIKKVVLDGSESWSTRSSGVGQLYETTVSGFFSTTSLSLGLSNQYASNINLTENNTFRIISGNTLAIHNDTISGLDNFKNALSSSNLIIYYPLATATDTEITDITLINQLEAINNAPLYEQTNITQTNNDLPMVLDITACKDNINGIKAFIRK